MSTRSERRDQRKSTARRRAETHATGFETTVLKLPEGVSFFDAKPGKHLIDIVPFKAGKGNPFADEGELHFERTFYTYRRVGIEEKTYVAPSKTFAKPDPIQDYRNKLMKDPDADADEIKSLAPKERQIFLIYDRKNPDKGLQIWETSFHTFGKLLDSRINNSDEEQGWDLFYFPDDDGKTLALTIEEQKSGKFTFNEVTAIDFLDRKSPIPDKILNHGICLDEVLVEVPYDKLKAIFLGVPEGEEAGEDSKPARKSKEEDKPKEEKKEESKKDSGKITADDLGIKKDDIVSYKGVKQTVIRISDDGVTVTLIDGNDDIIKAPAEDVRPWKEESKKEEKKEEPKKPLTADEAGLKKDDRVTYQGKLHSIIRISPDGTSLTLLRESDDEIIKAIGVAEVELDEVPFDKGSAKKEEPKSEDKDPSDDDENWDDDWDRKKKK